jgi:hypothetical protein
MPKGPIIRLMELTIKIGLIVSSWKKVATNGDARTVKINIIIPANIFDQNEVERCNSFISFLCIIAALKPNSLKMATKPINKVANPTIPKSLGDNNLASIMITIN